MMIPLSACYSLCLCGLAYLQQSMCTAHESLDNCGGVSRHYCSGNQRSADILALYLLMGVYMSKLESGKRLAATAAEALVLLALGALMVWGLDAALTLKTILEA